MADTLALLGFARRLRVRERNCLLAALSLDDQSLEQSIEAATAAAAGRTYDPPGSSDGFGRLTRALSAHELAVVRICDRFRRDHRVELMQLLRLPVYFDSFQAIDAHSYFTDVMLSSSRPQPPTTTTSAAGSRVHTPTTSLADLFAGSSVPSEAPEDGYCYLDLFDEDYVGAARRLLGRRPLGARLLAFALSNPSPVHKSGVFRVTFGSAASVRFSQARLMHVERVSAGESFLSARDVLDLVPWNAMVGQEDPDARVAAPVAVPGRDAGPFLGRAVDPMVRRFCCVHSGTVRHKPGVFSPVIYDPLEGAPRTWSDVFPYVAWTSLACRLVPTVHACRAHITVDVAWFPAGGTAPNSAALFDASPTRHRLVLAPASTGVGPEALIPFNEAIGISSQVKPPALFGGAPSLVVRYSWDFLPGHKEMPDDVALFSVVFEGTLSAHPPA